MADTPQYIFRNSSTKRGGFKGQIGNVKVDTELDIDGTEDINRNQELLNDADRALLRSNIATLTDCVLPIFCTEYSGLRTKAQTAWNRALTLYPDLKAQLDAEVEMIKEDTINRICLRENMWARTAGSSLNCIVQEMKNRAEIELARELAGVVADRLIRHKEHETSAIQAAFEHNMQAKMQPMELAFNQIGQLYNLLRGAEVTEVTDRDYTENRDESQNTFTLMGEFFHEGTDIADTDGKYASVVDDAITASQGLSGNFTP